MDSRLIFTNIENAVKDRFSITLTGEIMTIDSKFRS